MLKSKLKKDKAALVCGATLQNQINRFLCRVAMRCSIKIHFIGKEADLQERVLLILRFSEEKPGMTFDRERTPLSVILCEEGNENLLEEFYGETPKLEMAGNQIYLLLENDPSLLTRTQGREYGKRIIAEILNAPSK